MLAVIWWMYDGYAWLTNAIATERPRSALLLLGGMGAFLIIALAVPHAYEDDGLAFGLAYLVVSLLHTAMFVARGAAAARSCGSRRSTSSARRCSCSPAARSAATRSGCCG